MRRSTAAVLACVLAAVLAAGCGQAPRRTGEAEMAARGEAAVETIRARAESATADLDEARLGVLAAADTVGGVARAAAAIPAAAPMAVRLQEARTLLADEVRPRIDESLRGLEAIRNGTEDLAPLVATVADLAAERDRWQQEAAREKERADSAIRRWLLLTAAAGFAGILAGGALFVWLSRKAGLVVGLASLAVFAVSVTLYRWFEWFAWGGLALILLAVAALGYGLWKNRRAFVAVVDGGQEFKAAVAASLQAVAEPVRALFNRVHAATQAKAGGGVGAMVQDVKADE